MRMPERSNGIGRCAKVRFCMIEEGRLFRPACMSPYKGTKGQPHSNSVSKSVHAVFYALVASTSALMYIWQGHIRSAEQYNLVWSLDTQVRGINVFQRYNVPDDQVVSSFPKPKVRHWRKTPDTSGIPNRKQWRRKKWQLSARSSMLTQLPHIWTRDLHSSHYEAK